MAREYGSTVVPRAIQPAATDPEGRLIAEIKSLRRSAYELRARTAKLSDIVAGSRPENEASDKSEPGNVMELLAELGHVLDACHEELTRTTSLLGM